MVLTDTIDIVELQRVHVVADSIRFSASVGHLQQKRATDGVCSRGECTSFACNNMSATAVFVKFQQGG